MLTNLGLFLATTDLQKYTAVLCIRCGEIIYFSDFWKKNPFNKLLLLYEYLNMQYVKRKNRHLLLNKQTNKKGCILASCISFLSTLEYG